MKGSAWAFSRWALVAPALVLVGAILLKVLHVGAAFGYTFPFIAIGTAIGLGVMALDRGLATRTAVASLLGVLAGLVLAGMLAMSIL